MLVCRLIFSNKEDPAVLNQMPLELDPDLDAEELSSLFDEVTSAAGPFNAGFSAAAARTQPTAVSGPPVQAAAHTPLRSRSLADILVCPKLAVSCQCCCFPGTSNDHLQLTHCTQFCVYASMS